MNIRRKLIAATLAAGTIVGGGIALSFGAAAQASPADSIEQTPLSLPPHTTLTIVKPPRTLPPNITLPPPTTRPPTTTAPPTTAPPTTKPADPPPPVVVYVDPPVKGAPAFTG